MSEARLESWLHKVPHMATALEVRWDSINGKVVIARFELDELSKQGAQQVIEACTDHCDELEGRARYEIVWIDDNGRTLKTKAIRFDTTPSEKKDSDDAAFVTPSEANTASGITAMLMRHAETDRRMHNIAEANLLKYYRDALTDARNELVELRTENRDLRKKWKAAEAKNDGETDIEAEAKAEAYVKLTDAVTKYVIPLAVAHLGGAIGGNGNGNGGNH